MAHSRKKRTRTWRNIKKTTSQLPPTTTNSTPLKPTAVIKSFVSCSVQTEDEMPTSRRKQAILQDLESVSRITHLPIIESAWHYAENIYSKIKGANSLIHWTLDTAELSAQSVLETASPAIILLHGPISSLDKVVCKSLDIVEQAVPSINLPPEMIYYNTKQYVTEVSTKLAQPVLKRADSVKQIGNTVLASKYTAFAANTLDDALDVAEKYVDKYLPDDEDDQTINDNHGPINGPRDKAIQTIHHVDRFSRKLRRRLTHRTIAEVEALKHQSAEAVHVLIYVVELVTTDPVLAFKKGKELWVDLSKDEPENQARPDNLEQLIVLLTRESARRVVHLVNFTGDVLSRLPKRVSRSINFLVKMSLYLTDSVAKALKMSYISIKGSQDFGVQSSDAAPVSVKKLQVRKEVHVRTCTCSNTYKGRYVYNCQNLFSPLH
ncbi:lipid storage droplets surface-binding protein 1 isoform X2 [Leptinotarsa decemlineata]|uniref:lipid storage droplets surface-binding protein 1 isoform X2 n=1 Tax=Leptinotarsa decemlineata TaxID=7539 RepID=UPI003D30839E